MHSPHPQCSKAGRRGKETKKNRAEIEWYFSRDAVSDIFR